MKKLIVLLILIGLSSCAVYQNFISPVQVNLKQGQCDPALAELQKEVAKDNDDKLLYLMEYGSALQICGNYSKSSKVFIEADRLSEQIDYISLTRGLGATLLNEQMVQYKGDKFEKLFINAMAALNYVEMNDLENAAVEVRRINEKTKKFAEEEKRNFELNSFASYLSGVIYELNFKYDDACISYKEAYNLDPSYRTVAQDLLTACWRAKRTQEFNELIKKINATQEEVAYAKRSPKKSREIILFYLQGWGPTKAVRSDNHVYPYLQPNYSQTKKLEVTAILNSSSSATKSPLNSTATIISDPVYNVEKAAIQTLEADYAALGARRFGARIAKEVVADQIRQNDKALGNIAWLVMVASERADLRSWNLLPETIQVVRVNAENLKTLALIGKANDGTETEQLGKIDITENPNKRVYLVRSVK